MTCLSLLLYSTLLLISHSAYSTTEIGEESSDTNYLYSTSVASMTELLVMENKLLTQLRTYAKVMQQKLDMISLFQQMLKRLPTPTHKSQEEYVANSLNAYGLLRRLQQDWPKWLSYLQDEAARGPIERMQLLLRRAPSEQDLQLASKGLLRIERFYDLEASHMAKGLLLEQQTNAHLNPVDCMALGNHLLQLKQYSRSTHWFRTALRNYQQPYAKLYGQVLGVKRREISRAYAMAIAKETDGSEKPPQDKQMQEWQQLADSMLNDMVLKASNAKIKKLTNEYLAGDEEIFIKERAKHKPKPSAVQRGCRGLWPQRKLKHLLTCFYTVDDNPVMRLMPLKQELLSVDPIILLIHQVLGQSEIETLTNVSLYRSSKDFPKQSAKLFPLADTGIAHQFQMEGEVHVLNYGLGGYLQRHSKSICRSGATGVKSKKTDIHVQEVCSRRHMATMLVHVTDVPLGGATIFPKLQLLVQPKRGSALFWPNLDKHGIPDPLTDHAVCPVVVGSRWVLSNAANAKYGPVKQPYLV